MDLLGEVLAFVSGLVLLRPAWRVNALLRMSADLKDILESSDAAVERQVIPTVLERLQAAGSDWNAWDQRCLRLGAATFVASAAIKLVASLVAAPAIRVVG
jgi:hypothetical protein